MFKVRLSPEVRNTLLRLLLVAGFWAAVIAYARFAPAQAAPFAPVGIGDGEGVEPPSPPNGVINMLDYLVPDQTWDDPEPFHLVGYSRCIWGECVDRGEPPYSETSFTKVYRMPDSATGDTRYAAMKTPTKPAEYFTVKNSYERGRWVSRAFLEAEDMFWGLEGWELRDYHDASGYPTFEWGRSDVAEGAENIQTFPWCTWRYCGRKPDWRELTSGIVSVYTVQEFDLRGDHRAIAQKLGDRVFTPDMATEVLPKWLSLALELRRGEPKLMVISGYWSPVASGATQADPSLWYHREVYSYLEGVGWVGWWWQMHAGYDQSAPFSTIKGGVNYKAVWEDPKKPILAFDVCSGLPVQSGDPKKGDVWTEPRRLLIP
jgi:hypothetical protein